MDLVIEKDDRLEKIVMVLDKNNFIRSLAFFTEKDYLQLGSYDMGEERAIEIAEKH